MDATHEVEEETTLDRTVTATERYLAGCAKCRVDVARAQSAVINVEADHRQDPSALTFVRMQKASMDLCEHLYKFSAKLRRWTAERRWTADMVAQEVESAPQEVASVAVTSNAAQSVASHQAQARPGWSWESCAADGGDSGFLVLTSSAQRAPNSFEQFRQIASVTSVDMAPAHLLASPLPKLEAPAMKRARRERQTNRARNALLENLDELLENPDDPRAREGDFDEGNFDWTELNSSA